MRTIRDWLKYVEETKQHVRERERPAPPPASGTPEQRPTPPRRLAQPRSPAQGPEPRVAGPKETPSAAERQAPPPVKVERGSRPLPPTVRPIEAGPSAPGKPRRKGQSPERIKELMSSIDAALQFPLPLPSPAREAKAVGRRKRSPFSESRESLIHRLVDPELRLREVALLLNVCPATVRRYANRGSLPYSRTPGNQRRFHLSDVVDFIHRRRTKKSGAAGEPAAELEMIIPR